MSPMANNFRYAFFDDLANTLTMIEIHPELLRQLL